jgi:hypothetical protein
VSQGGVDDLYESASFWVSEAQRRSTSSLGARNAQYPFLQSLRFLMEAYLKAILLISVIAVIGALNSGCVTVALAPGADKVRLTKNPADVTTCKVVGNVKRPPDSSSLDIEPSIRNQAVGLGGNTVFISQEDISGALQGVSYQCP